ncbi:MAG: beta-ketoacyl synthase N-terminal-like domain-containing protein [Chthoniobacteraceae bacterium]
MDRVAISGLGWVTPLGNGLDEVWQRLQAGERAPVGEVKSPQTGRSYPCIAVPKEATAALNRNPRLRRSSVISFFTTAAALAALEHAGLKVEAANAERIAVVFAVSNGGVVYTRKFYETIVAQGAGAASPLLFPETVYNAPASHLAAVLGITGLTYTLVGDASVGIAALKYGEQLLLAGEADHCIVVGGEEIDWVLCEAYREWRLPVTLSEGAAAIVLSREGRWRCTAIHEGVPFAGQNAAKDALQCVLGDLAKVAPAAIAVTSANGTFIDAIESAALGETFPEAALLQPKTTLGEAPGAGALMQTVIAALAVENRPGVAALVSCLGLNQQASGLVLEAV